MTLPTYDDTRRELATDAGTLVYHEYGDGPPLLLLHGSGPGVTGWRNFHQNLPALGAHFRCLVLELPGFGVSHDIDESPFAAAGPAVVRFVEALGLGPVPVIGNSMGGVVAAQLAIARDDLFSRIVTVGGIGTNVLGSGPGEGIVRLTDFVENPTREGLVQWLRSMVFDQAMVTEELIQQRWDLATEPETLASARRMYGREANAARARMAAASDRPPYWAMLHKITAPVLLTWGRDDRVSPVDMALVPMRTIPNAELHVLPRCGHWAMIEQQAAWEAAVLAFLTREDAQASTHDNQTVNEIDDEIDRQIGAPA